MEGLSPTTGALMLDSAGTAGYYSRDRGLGADDMLVTSAGLWIGSDNYDGSQHVRRRRQPGGHLLPAVPLAATE